MQADLSLAVCHNSLAGITVYEQGLVGRSLAALGCCPSLRLDKFIAVDDLVCGELRIAGVGHKDMLRTLFGLADALHGQIVGAEDHILRRNGYRVAILRSQKVICREHEDSSLSLCLR